MYEEYNKKMTEMFSNFIKTGIQSAIIKERPPKRGPLGKKVNRRKFLTMSIQLSITTVLA
jgi:hypothetical protein